LHGEADLARAVDNVRALGWEPVVAEHALARDGYFAGDDATRSRDLARAISDPAIDGIWCIRGGYGSMRILDALDLSPLAKRPKPVLGFSDITALHAAIGVRCGIVSFHGPTARRALTDFSRASIARALAARENPCGTATEARIIRPGSAHGRLAGGNLALLASLCGTPWLPSLAGAIVVLEDINEATYRVDRMLQQLRLAGALDGCVAIAFGHCTSCPEEADDGGGSRPLDVVLEELAARLDVPCIAGIPVGHVDDQWTIPLRAMATLDVEARSLTVDMPADGASLALDRRAPTHHHPVRRS
jgi:muramoyltetrapeptide carboxypeptidase